MIDLREGDVMTRLREIADESVQCCVTSPPYWGLRDYGVPGQLGLERTPEEYVAKMVEGFREVRRVLRSDGVLWLNVGDAYAQGNKGNSGAIRPGDKQGTNAGSLATRRGDSLGPNRNGGTKGLCKPKDLVGIPWLVAFALRADGWWLRQDIIWHKPNPMPESVRDRCTKSHEYLFLLSKSERYYFDWQAMQEPSVTCDPRRPYTSEGAWQLDGRPSEQRHGGKPRTAGNKSHKYVTAYESAEDEEHRYKAGLMKVADKPWATRNRRDVWSIATQPYKGAHFAVFPEKLVEPCILAGSRVGDTVLDPFCGSGTVGVVSARHSRSFIGIDLNPQYIELARQRCGLPVEAAMAAVAD